jgi:hypothetical protein
MSEASLANWVLIGGLVLSVMANAGAAIQYILNRKTSTEVNAYSQLSQLFETLQKLVKEYENRDKEQTSEIIRLEDQVWVLAATVRKTRLDLIDLKRGLKAFRAFIILHKIKNDDLLATIDEIEVKLQEVEESLK